MNARIGVGRALGKSGVSETLGDGRSQKTVVLLRFISESEETEEDERGNDNSPSFHLIRIGHSRTLAVHDPRVLEDTGKSPVGVSPGDPRANIAPHSVHDDNAKGHRNGKDEIDGSQGSETPVTAVSQVAVGGDKILELLSPPHERTDGEDWRFESATGEGGKEV